MSTFISRGRTTFIGYGTDDQAFDCDGIEEAVELQINNDIENRGYKPTSVTIYACRFEMIEWRRLIGGNDVPADDHVREMAWERLADIIGTDSAERIGDLERWMPDGTRFKPWALSPFAGGVGKSWPIRVGVNWNEKGDGYTLAEKKLRKPLDCRQ